MRNPVYVIPKCQSSLHSNLAHAGLSVQEIKQASMSTKGTEQCHLSHHHEGSFAWEIHRNFLKRNTIKQIVRGQRR